MTIQTILQYAGALALVIGPVGTALESIGNAFKVPFLVALGTRFEAIGADIPKLVRGSRFDNATVAELAKQMEKKS